MSLDQFPYPVEQIAQLNTAVQQALASQMHQLVVKSILVIPPFQLTGRRQAARPTRRFDWLCGTSQPSRTPEWTLLLTAERLVAAARDTSTANVEVTLIPLASLIAFEWGSILLYSWIDLVWADPALRHTRIEFNAVGEEYLRPLLATLRRATLDRTPPVVDQRTPLTDDQIWALPMKFANMLNHALLPDEHVYTMCFEPTLRPKWLRRHSREGWLWAVTNRHGLFIREPRESYPYGVVYTFCPRGEIREARLVETERAVELHLTVGAAGFEVTGIFPPARATELAASLQPLTSQRVTA